MPIREIDFRKIDLNLLVVFHALLRERSVRKAAERMALTASAVSMSLRRLRELFDDELFVRSGHRMLPTSRAEALGPQIEALLESALRMVYDHSAFRPADLDRVFSIAATESCAVGVVGLLLAELLREAPRARLIVTGVTSASAAEVLDAGDVDLAFGHFKSLPAHLDSVMLCRHRFVCLFAPGTAQAPVTLDAYLEADHVLMSSVGDLTGAVDAQLKAMGQQRRVVASTSRFAALPSWLRAAPLIATVPEHVARGYGAGDLQVSPLPFESPSFDVEMAWPRRLADDQANVWLRRLARRVTAGLDLEAGAGAQATAQQC